MGYGARRFTKASDALNGDPRPFSSEFPTVHMPRPRDLGATKYFVNITHDVCGESLMGHPIYARIMF